MNIYEELQWRGLLADCTDAPELIKRLATGPTTLYCGFDPIANSLHVGNLVPLLALRRFQSIANEMKSLFEALYSRKVAIRFRLRAGLEK